MYVPGWLIAVALALWLAPWLLEVLGVVAFWAGSVAWRVAKALFTLTGLAGVAVVCAANEWWVGFWLSFVPVYLVFLGWWHGQFQRPTPTAEPTPPRQLPARTAPRDG